MESKREGRVRFCGRNWETFAHFLRKTSSPRTSPSIHSRSYLNIDSEKNRQEMSLHLMCISK